MAGPREPAAVGRRHWARDLHVSAFWALMLGVVVLAVVVLSPTVHLYVTQQHQIASLRSSVAQEEGRLDAARQQLARWDDPSYVRSQARERLYFVMPGETSYLIIDNLPHSVAAPTKTPARKTIQTTATNWVDTVFASTVSAGVTPGLTGAADTGAAAGAGSRSGSASASSTGQGGR